MLVAVTAMLVSVAEISNIISMSTMVLFFCVMLFYVMKNVTMLWLYGEDFVFGGAVHNMQPSIPQMKVMKVLIPFTFKLEETSTSSYKEVQCTVSSQVCYRLLAYWGVSIRELHVFLWKPWNLISNAIDQGVLLDGHYQQKGLDFRKVSHGDKVVTMSLPQEHLDLGTPPRLCYPLVIFLVRESEGTLHPDETVALINVVHIKDAVCSLPTSVLAQYLKQANGQLSALKQLYLATGNPESYDSGLEILEGSEQLCVVCQFFPLSRALLPCRHTCICASCFGKLDTCPMCRSPIKSFFCIRNEDYLPECDKSGSPAVKYDSVTQWLQDRLIDFLGFHR